MADLLTIQLHTKRESLHRKLGTHSIKGNIFPHIKRLPPALQLSK
ncbi:hypothetical protein BLGI_2613 [Brevibacillus laterosporus GI-9]|nr:hypothetical protein BLGI_2613 [Brevibacillus laterosporus GI-9]